MPSPPFEMTPRATSFWVLSLLLLAAAISAHSQATSCGCETTLASGLQWIGNMFDIVVDAAQDIVVEAFEQNMLAGGATGEVYYRAGTYFGNEQAADWIQVGRQAVNGSGPYSSSGQLARLPLEPSSLTLVAGQTYGIAIVMLGTNLVYSVGNASYDECLGYTIATGIGIGSAPPIASSVAGRSWNGRVQTTCATTSGVGTTGTSGSAIVTTGGPTTGTSGVATTTGVSATTTTTTTTDAGTTGTSGAFAVNTGVVLTTGVPTTSTGALVVGGTTRSHGSTTSNDASGSVVAALIIGLVVVLPCVAIVIALFIARQRGSLHWRARQATRPSSEEYRQPASNDIEMQEETEESDESGDSEDSNYVVYADISAVLHNDDDDVVPFTDLQGKALHEGYASAKLEHETEKLAILKQ